MVFKAAAVQMCSGVDPEKNAESMARLVREAHRRGAIYVQTPEMTGAVQKDRAGLAAVLRARYPGPHGTGDRPQRCVRGNRTVSTA